MRVRDGVLVDVDLSGYVERLVVNGVDVTGFVAAELDRRHPERVQLREMRGSDDFRAMWATLGVLWDGTVERAGRLPEAALDERVDEEWSFLETLRHLVFVTDAWVSRTVLDEERPYHRLGLPQSWYPATDAVALGIDVEARPSADEVLAARASRREVVGSVLGALTDDVLGRPCPRPPAPGYPQEERAVWECLAVALEEEVEHHRYATRDLAVARGAAGVALPGQPGARLVLGDARHLDEVDDGRPDLRDDDGRVHRRHLEMLRPQPLGDVRERGDGPPSALAVAVPQRARQRVEHRRQPVEDVHHRGRQQVRGRAAHHGERARRRPVVAAGAGRPRTGPPARRAPARPRPPRPCDAARPGRCGSPGPPARAPAGAR